MGAISMNKNRYERLIRYAAAAITMAFCLIWLTGPALAEDSTADASSDQSRFTAQQTERGTCGDGVSWVLDTGLGWLTFEGTGAIRFDSGNAPWVDYADRIEYIQIDEGITSIPSAAFSNLPNLERVRISDSALSAISRRAFAHCAKLQSVELGGCTGLQTLGPWAFWDCVSLDTVELPDNLSSIGDCAFLDCPSLQHLGLPYGLRTLGYAFAGGTSIAELTLPASLETCRVEWGESSDGEPTIGILSGMNSLTTVVLQDGMEEVPAYILYRVSAEFDVQETCLSTLVVPKSVKTFATPVQGPQDWLEQVHYKGSQYDWERIFDEDWTTLLNVSVGSTTPPLICDEVSIRSVSVSGVGVQVYSGSPVCPEPVLTHDGETLVRDVDYSITYKNNEAPGTGRMVIKGLGAYTGTITSSFVIQGNIERAKVSAIAKQYFLGSAIKPVPSVEVDGTKLTKDTDYKLSYANNEKVGTEAQVIITGIGKYAGTKTVLFTIAKTPLKKATITAPSAKTYTGAALVPKPTVVYNGTKLKLGTHYKLTYSNNTNAGTASIKIVGIGSCTGSRTVTFKINRRSISKATVSKIAAQKYTGKAIKPKPTVKVNGIKLKNGKGYTLTYKNNKKRGTATITITGKGNYTGTKRVTFKIK